jgi:hypothetical protein
MPTEPKPGERIPGTDYIRCETNCEVKKKGGGFEKRHCEPTAENGCTPNDPDDPEKATRCHCRPFRYDPHDKKWKEIERDKNGDFDFEEGDKCFCVRIKKQG